MRGHHVARKGGWDCHGLPVEVQVEQELGIHNKHEIEAFGIGEFNRLCRESVHRYVADFESLTRRIGMWLDTDDAYWTLDNSYIETVWWLSARCGTPATSTRATRWSPTAGAAAPRCRATSSASPARTRTSPSRRSTCASRWSTATSTSSCGPPRRGRSCRTSAPRWVPTSSTCASKARTAGATWCMGAARVADVLGDDAEVLGPVPVDELVGLHYERPFDFLELGDGGARVVAADFVTVDDGSGIVHLAPAFGEIDREVADVEGLPMLNPVGPAADVRRHHRRHHPVDGHLREGRRPRDRRRARRGRQARARRRLHPLVPALLALWHSARLLGEAHVVRAHLRAQGRTAARERDDRVAPRAHQARALRRLAGEQRRLGAVARPLLGHAPPGVALRRLRHRHLHRLRGRALRALRSRPQPTSTCTAPRSTTSPSTARSASGPARVASIPCSTRGSTPARCRRRSSTTRSSARTSSTPGSPPTSSARPSTRRAAGSTRCSR